MYTVLLCKTLDLNHYAICMQTKQNMSFVAQLSSCPAEILFFIVLFCCFLLFLKQNAHRCNGFAFSFIVVSMHIVATDLCSHSQHIWVRIKLLVWCACRARHCKHATDTLWKVFCFMMWPLSFPFCYHFPSAVAALALVTFPLWSLRRGTTCGDEWCCCARDKESFWLWSLWWAITVHLSRTTCGDEKCRCANVVLLHSLPGPMGTQQVLGIHPIRSQFAQPACDPACGNCLRSD